MIEHFSDEYSTDRYYVSKAESITKLAQCLIVSMKERMGDAVYDDPWWSQDYIALEKECKKVLGINEN